MASLTETLRERGLVRKVRAGDIELQVMRRGQGMPLMLVHGFPLDHSMWEADSEFLTISVA